MKIALVNQLHHDAGKVGSVRMWRLAQELASLGHEVLFICPKLPAAVKGAKEEDASNFRRHATGPIVLTAGPATEHLAASRRRPVKRLGSKLGTAWSLLIRGGPYWRWRRSIRQMFPRIRAEFCPDVCVGCFGSIDALLAAKELAAYCRVPWVMDIKDAADAFLPRSIRPLLMWRASGAHACTVNAKFQISRNPGWIPASGAKLLYSGVEQRATARPDFEPDRIVLAGSVYDPAGLAVLLEGFRLLLVERPLATLEYYGGDGESVREAAVRVGIESKVLVLGQVERMLFLERCASAACVAYVGFPSAFHHKLLELAVLGRPIVVAPTESVEGIELSGHYEFPLECVSTPADASDAFRFAGSSPTRENAELANDFSWQAVARRLEKILVDVVEGNR